MKIGVLGVGQLGRMLALSASPLGHQMRFLALSNEGYSSVLGKTFTHNNNPEVIKKFADDSDVVTYESENIDIKIVNQIRKTSKVYPSDKSLHLTQHRAREKDLLKKLNIPCAPYELVNSISDLKSAIDNIGLPAILKTATEGYDGKGQYKINSIKELNEINLDYNQDYIIEKFIDLKKEISVVLTRYGDQKYEIYEPIENIHEDQILKNSKIPAEISKKIFDLSKEWTIQIAEELKYIGTLCVEFFIDRNENLYVNEIAPRVHNSGHLTINAYNVSQFENHVRAVCSLEKIPLKKLYNAKMINLIGDQIEPYRQNIKLDDNQFFFDYLKKKIKEKRKMGHITTLI